ncbi:MAG: response regulator [Symploca sp. SIO3C6]|nr:response regulator [Symploca sp. SIO3C6]
MKLKLKFIAGFLGTASLVALLGAVNLNNQKNVNQQFNQVTREVVPELIALEEIKILSLRMMSEAYSYSLIKSESDHPNPINLNQDLVVEIHGKEDAQEEKDEFEEAMGSLGKILTELELNSKNLAIQSIAEKIYIVYRKLYQVSYKIIWYKQEGRAGKDIIVARQQLEIIEENLLEIVNQAINLKLEELELENSKTNQIAEVSQLINLTAVAAVIAISLTLGIFLAQRITKPIILLKEAASKIGQGKFDTKVDIKTQDELKVLADAFNKMVDQLEETTVSKSYLNNIIRSLSDALIVFNKNKKIKRFNTAILSMSGYQSDELLEQPLNLIFRQNDWLDVLNFNQDKNSIQNSFLGRRETILMAKDGCQLPVSVTASVMENAEGELEGFVCLVQDISAKKKAQAALRRQALMFETIYDGVIITDFQGRIIDYNPAAEGMFGYKKDEVLGKNANIVYRTTTQIDTTKCMLDSLLAEGRWAGEIEFIRNNGSQGVCETVFVPLHNERGELTAAMGVNHDITERKQHENQLIEARETALQATQAKSQFLANMSHEIRTPMNGVLGMSELLLTTELTTQQRDFVQTLQVSGEHLLRVINDILDFSKLEAGEMQLDISEFSLNQCLEEVLDLCSTQANKKNLELCLFIDNEVPRQLAGDAGRLRQILTNLIFNAIKFTDQGEVVIQVSLVSVAEREMGRWGDGEKELSVRDQFGTNSHWEALSLLPQPSISEETIEPDKQQPIQLRFAVKDTGIGITPADQKKLFQSFSQVDESSTRKYTGTGLGLSICKQLVELMAGKIGVESQRGVGSTFWFTANLGKVSADSSTEIIDQIDNSIPASLDFLIGKRVLVVDDRAINRQIVQHQLSAKGMEVDEAENGIAALNALQVAAEAGKLYDVALLDMKLPKIDGSTLGRLILAQPDWAQTKLVLMTSLHAGDTGEPLLKSGFSDYLVKPVKESRLLHSLLKVLAPQQHSPIIHQHWIRNEEASIFEQGQQQGLKILLVEDTPINLKLVKHQVRMLGYQADWADNGQQALEKLAFGNYDIVLMDCQMPVMDGYQATQSLRQREGTSHHTIVIGMTAYAMQGDRQKCLEAGMDDYLSKPVMIKDLGPMLKRWSSLLQSDLEAEKSLCASETGIFDSKAKSHSCSELIDWQHLKEISGGEPSFQLELVQEFIQDAATWIDEAKQALAAQDSDALAKKAHQIQGASSSVAMPKISQIAAQLYTQVKGGNLEGADELIAELESDISRL